MFRNRRKLSILVSLPLILIVVVSLVVAAFSGLIVPPSKWVKVGEVSGGGFQDWQEGEIYVGETWGTLFIQAIWHTSLPPELYEQSTAGDITCGITYGVSRSMSILFTIAGVEHHVTIKQGLPQVWVFVSPNIFIVSTSISNVSVTIGLRVSPPPNWFAPLNSLLNVRVNSSYAIFSSAQTSYLNEFPYYSGNVVTTDGIIDEWSTVENLTLTCAPQTTRSLPGAIVNTSTFASDLQLAFMIAYSQSLNTTRALYPDLEFSADFWAAIGWYSENYYYSYSGNFHLANDKSNLIIHIYDVSPGIYETDEFSIDNIQWEVEMAFEWYLNESQASNFYQLYPAEDYTVAVSSELIWTYEMPSVTQTALLMAGFNVTYRSSFWVAVLYITRALTSEIQLSK